MIVPQSISQLCSIISSIKLSKVKSNPQIFKYSPSRYIYFHKIRKLQVRAYAIYAKLSDKESFCHKIALKRGFRIDHDNCYVNNMERTFYSKEIEARRELASVGLISKHHYQPQIIQFDVLDDPRWQANIEAKQGHFQLDRYRHFAFQHGSMVYNPRDHEWIPNATDNPWTNCPGRNPQDEYHVIHPLGWSLQLTNMTLTLDVKSESIYFFKDATALPTTLLKPHLFGHPKSTVLY